MDSRLLAYAERPAPRYTSYPTAPHFTAEIDGGVVSGWLSELTAETTISLYLHVPYCKQMCWYCGCNTYAARRDEPVMDFVETLLKEIDLVAEQLNARRVTEIHWGGGTPNILTPEQFTRISERLAGTFDLSRLGAHAIELDPRYVDQNKAAAYAKAAVTRVSFGVQDLNERVQQAIGRVQPIEVVERAVRHVRDAGIAEINMDLMYGLPHQTETDLRNSITMAAALRPDRFALFGYAHVPWFKKRQRLISEATLPDTAERFDQAETARAELTSLGYVAIGLDHFALPADELTVASAEGRLRRSFQGYVIEEADAIVGLGPSSISTLPQGYAQNAPEPGAWAHSIAQGRLAHGRGHALSQDDRVRRRLIEQIMCDFEGDLAPLGGAGACESELATLSPMFADGMVHLKDDKLELAADARPFCRLVGMAFDAYAARGVARHSRAV